MQNQISLFNDVFMLEHKSFLVSKNIMAVLESEILTISKKIKPPKTGSDCANTVYNGNLGKVRHRLSKYSPSVLILDDNPSMTKVMPIHCLQQSGAKRTGISGKQKRCKTSQYLPFSYVWCVASRQAESCRASLPGGGAGIDTLQPAS